MKLLKTLISHQPKNVHDQVLEWLYWLKNYCNNRDCPSCEFYNREASFFRCEVRNIYRDMAKPCYQIVPPNAWKLPQGHITPKRPLKLDFLRDLHWDEGGNPISLPKGDKNEIIKDTD